MGSFKKIQDTSHLRRGYFKRAIVYLESGEDLLIIKDRWFHNEGEYLEFKSADEGDGGGASRVVNMVNGDRASGFIAFGLVDRDALQAKQKWNEWWERDDMLFSTMRPLGEHIRVLRRWEIENYLLDPEIVEEERANLEGRAVARLNAVEKLAKDVLMPAKLLASAAIVLHEQGAKLGDDLNRIEPTEELVKKVSEKIGDKTTQFKETLKRIEFFGEGHPETSNEYWERISRVLDGKRILKRLGLAQSSLDKPKDYRLSLASKIRQSGKIDFEFNTYIKEFKNAAREAV